MLDHKSFSALRLSRIFSPDYLQSYTYYIELEPNGSFDEEYMGGQWHEELIDGVQFFYSATDPDKLGIVQLWGSGCMIGAAVRERPASNSAALVPGWAANVDRVLEALRLPVRLGSDETAIRGLAAGEVHSSDFPDAWYELYPDVERRTLRSLSFACRAPDIYHMKAVVHAAMGLQSMAVMRPDVIRANDRDGGYDACFASLYDEGPG